MAEQVKQGQIDEVSQEAMKEQVDLGIGNAKQMARTELNFYCEFYAQLKELNKELSQLHQTMNMLGEDKLMAYFKEVNDNFRQEEIRAKNREKISQGHKKSCKK